MTGGKHTKSVDSYKSYLQYKKLFKFLELGPEVTFMDISKLLDTTEDRAKYIIKLLLQHKVLKFSGYLLANGNKYHVHKLA